MTAEELAKLFHDTYERLAPAFGWRTQKQCSVAWDDLPQANRALMVATCTTLLKHLDAEREALAVEWFSAGYLYRQHPTMRNLGVTQEARRRWAEREEK